MIGTLIQFKLVSGEEIACEVVDFPSEEDNDFTIKNALILLRNSTNPTEPQYLFKPWIAMMESDEDYISLSSDKVIALCEPTRSFHKEYTVAKSQLHSISKMRQSYYDALDNEYIQNIVDELGDLYSTYEDEDLEPVEKSSKEDNSKGTVLQFPKKDDDTVH
jgi:hypothetical protein